MSKTMKWGEDPEFSGPRNWFRESLIIQRINKYAAGKKVLDFGCGSGNLLLRLSPQGFSGKGVDISKLAIKYLREQIEKLNLSNKIDAQIGNENYLLSTKDKFDVLVSGETLEHIKDEDKVIKGFYRVLKKEGICVVSVPAHKKLWDINDDFSGHFRRYERKDLKKIFLAAGFKIEKCFYWGFPLGLIWHRFIFLPLIKRKVEKKGREKPFGFWERSLSRVWWKKVGSLLFWFDQLFNWTKLGGGLLLVARK